MGCHLFWPYLSSVASRANRGSGLAGVPALAFVRDELFLEMGVCILRFPIVAGSAANLALQYSHTPSTGKLFSRLTILNLRFVMPQVSHRYASSITTQT